MNDCMLTEDQMEVVEKLYQIIDTKMTHDLELNFLTKEEDDLIKPNDYEVFMAKALDKNSSFAG